MSSEDSEVIEIRPQAGPQEQFLSTTADIAFYGGAAGGGKSYALLLDQLRHLGNSRYRAVLFRRTMPQITNPGGLWDEANTLYPLFGAQPLIGPHTWAFPGGMTVKFAHMQLESDKFAWQGSQLAYIGFDEVTHFTFTQFFYMLSRLRSMSGVKGRVRATCNPDPDSWVADFISWWIEQDENHPNYGYPIPERAGKIRWFVREGESFSWADTKDELWSRYSHDPHYEPMSVTFIPAKVTDNKILLENDPSYMRNLNALNRVDRGRLRDGNWKVRAAAGIMFQRSWFEVVDAPPANIVARIRYWDRAATEPHESNPDPDWTVGLELLKDGYGVFYINHIERFRARPLKVKQRIKAISELDGIKTRIGIEEDPGSAGKSEADDLVRFLSGKIVHTYKATKDKVTRAKPVSAQCEAGNIKLVRGHWNAAFLDEIEAFPTDGVHDDQVDALSGAYNALTGVRSILDAMTKM